MSESTGSNARSLEDQIAQAVEDIVRPLKGVLENELRSLVAGLASAITAEHTARVEEASDAARAEKEAAVREAQDAVRSEHEAALNEARLSATAEREKAVREAHAAAEAATSATIAAAVSNALADAKAESEASLASAKSDAELRLHERLSEADASAARALEASVTDALASEREADLVSVERLLETLRTIDQARSISEVLDALASHALNQPGRVAVFLVRDQLLRGWRFGGFPELTGDPREIELRLDESGVIARAVSAHDCAATSDRDPGLGDAEPIPPGSLLHLKPGRAGFAAPVCVAGQVVAVVYADEGNSEEPPVPSPWPELVEITARHASRCLELLMAARIAAVQRSATSAPAVAAWPHSPGTAGPLAPAPAHGDEDDEEAARRYARLLISEIKLYHESDVNEGKRERDLLKRLKPEIDRARRLYEERVAPEVRARADCFEQELVRTLADGNAGLLGQAP